MGSDVFEFTVSDAFLIEGRGLILSPFFPVDRYQFAGKEHLLIETPDGRRFEADADIEIPLVSPAPKVHQAMFVIRTAQKADIPLGSRISLPHKTVRQIQTEPHR
jgi:hypothetical protein